MSGSGSGRMIQATWSWGEATAEASQLVPARDQEQSFTFEDVTAFFSSGFWLGWALLFSGWKQNINYLSLVGWGKGTWMTRFCCFRGGYNTVMNWKLGFQQLQLPLYTSSFSESWTRLFVYFPGKGHNFCKAQLFVGIEKDHKGY